MKFLIIGGGSMGKRRARCLLANGVEAGDIRIVDPRDDRRGESLSKYGVGGFGDIQAGLKWNPAAVMVCIPGEAATEVCALSLEAGKNVFCEVPMGLNASETRRLGEVARQRGVLAAAGAQQPFHPLVKQCRQWLGEGGIGKAAVFTLEWCQYVPGWHPYEKLTDFFTAAQLTGVMNLEIVQLYFITGDRIRELKCMRRQATGLQTPGGDVCDIIGDTRGGMAVSMHFDLIQRPMRNMARFISEQGTIEIDFAADRIGRYLAADKQWESRGVPAGWAYEQCYIDEIALFMKCVEGKAQWHNPLEQAVDVAAVLDAMSQSSGQTPVEV